MNLRLLHRRMAVLMGLAGLVAFSGGAGFEPLSAALAAAALLTALFWHPSPELSSRLEQVWVPLAAILVVRALYHVFFVGDDVVIPVVDLLLLLLSAESLRSLDAPNDARIYALSFALILASAAYRPGILFALAFLAFVALGTVALTVGHLRRSAETRGIRRVEISRRFLWGTAGLSGITILVSGAVFLTFPRVSRGWSGAGEAPAASIAGFADEVSLGAHGSRIYGNPQIVLRVEFPDREPATTESLYWRGRSYDHFDGVRWFRSERLSPSLAPTEWYEKRWGGETLVQEVYAVPLDARVIFALHPVVNVEAESRIQPLFDNAGDFTYWGSAPPVYRAVSITGRPGADQLRSAEGHYTPARGNYLQLPDLDPRIAALADSLTRGLDNRYDQAAAIRDWLRTEFSYTRELPATSARATLEHFLFRRRAGHCEYFSTALAVLLRSRGIPARNVNGFLGGEWSEFGQYLAVTQNEAHSWVEVWYPGYGWVPMDATPAGTAGGSSGTVWFWPGRFLWDGIQHRWGKWVLDYSLDTQWNLLDRARALLGDDAGEGSDEGEGGETGSGRFLRPMGVLLALLGTVLVLLRTRDAVPPATRFYLGLREAAERAGMEDASVLPPLALVRRLEDAGHPSAGPASRLVHEYLRVRFGGTPLTDDARHAMKGALKRARATLGSAPVGAREGRP